MRDPSDLAPDVPSPSAGAFSRRDWLKTIGVAAAATTVPTISVAAAQDAGPHPLGSPPALDYKKPKRPLTAIVIGAGARGNVYSSYAQKFPEELQIVGVAEPIPYRNERMAQTYGIKDEHRFVTWEHVFDVPKFADAVIVTTPDELHYGPAMAALDQGYQMILEKVIAQTWRECNDILKLARKRDAIVAVCHVMRYSPYFRQLKHVLDSGIIGEVVSVQHLEPVEHLHMAHSFVRGNWRNTKESNPMILSKSCHDTDILRWLIGKRCKRVTSFGSLRLFREEMAPEGATKRCTGGCAVERDCPFSAIKAYLERKSRLSHLRLEENSDDAIRHALETGPYGRCVFHCDNDVVDHQIMNMEFEDGITAAFSMEALTTYAGRRTRFMGTMGDIVGDEWNMQVTEFGTGKRHDWNVQQHAQALLSSGHGGGDHALVRDFVQAVTRSDPSLLTSTIEASMESHLMGFMAEESRLQGGAVQTIDLKL